MSEEFTVRAARAQDVETLADYNCRIALETEDWRLDPPTVLRGVRAVLENPSRGAYYVVEEPTGPGIIGQCMVTHEWSDWRAADFWWIQSVYVHPEWRRRSVFTTLFRWLEARARTHPDVCGLRLYVEARNARAIDTYRRLGMSPSGHLLYEIHWS